MVKANKEGTGGRAQENALFFVRGPHAVKRGKIDKIDKMGLKN
jgi:hypothetical protein